MEETFNVIFKSFVKSNFKNITFEASNLIVKGFKKN